jgi:hypothetical protein
MSSNLLSVSNEAFGGKMKVLDRQRQGLSLGRNTSKHNSLEKQ